MTNLQRIEKNGYTLNIENDGEKFDVSIKSAEDFHKKKYKIELLPEQQDDGSYEILITVAIVGMTSDIEVIKKAQARMVEVIEVHELFKDKLNEILGGK